MKPMASILSVLAFAVLLLKGFDTNGVMSAAEAAAAPGTVTVTRGDVLSVTRTRTATATTITTTRTKTSVFEVPKPPAVKTQTSSVTKVK